MAAPEFRIIAIELYERPVALRIPFRFGAATVTHSSQAFVRAGILLDDGHEAHGAAAELMIPKWFDKSPQKSNADNIEDLRRSLSCAAAAYAMEPRALTAFGHFAAHYGALITGGAGVGLNPLTSNYGPALIDRAILDALCHALCVSFSAAIRANLPGINTSLTPELAGFAIDRFLGGLTVSPTIAAEPELEIAIAIGGENFPQRRRRGRRSHRRRFPGDAGGSDRRLRQSLFQAQARRR